MAENNIINFDFEGQGIRVLEINGEPWFIGRDVAEVLGYNNTRDALRRHVDAEDKGVANCDTLGGKQELTAINESGLYSLIVGSKLPSAKKFKRWVTSEVLPSIRKHGGYIAGQENLELSQEEFLARAMQVANKVLEDRAARIAALEAQNAKQTALIEEMKPKASYYDEILKTPNTVLVSQIAKDYGMSAMKLNGILSDKKIQYKRNGQWLLYQTYAEKGYTRSETHIWDHYGRSSCSVQTKWTQKGRQFIYELLKADGILPLCEK